MIIKFFWNTYNYYVKLASKNKRNKNRQSAAITDEEKRGEHSGANFPESFSFILIFITTSAGNLNHYP